MTDNLASRFATEPPDGTRLLAVFEDVPPLLIQRDDESARAVGRPERHWWNDEIAAGMTLAEALADATEVFVVVPLERSGLKLADTRPAGAPETDGLYRWCPDLGCPDLIHPVAEGHRSREVPLP